MISLKHSASVILIGASTGGPGLLEKIFSALSKDFCTPIVIAQHMSKSYLESFARRVERTYALDVVFVESRSSIESGKVYILSDSACFESDFSLQMDIDTQDKYNPLIDKLFFSAAKLTNTKISAYLLSGIGADGANGLLALKNAGAKTVAQDEQSSAVYGMPKVAKEIGAATKIANIDEICKQIAQES